MKKIKVLSLFSGCGGMDLGIIGGFPVHEKSVSKQLRKQCTNTENKNWIRLPETKFEIIFSNDILREAKAAYIPYFSKRKSNHTFENKSIVTLVKEAENNSFKFPKCDVVVGGFPCQDFSVAGKRLGLNSQKSHMGKLDIDIPNDENRGHLYMWMKKVIEFTKPKAFIAENVKGLVSLGDVKKVIENDFRHIGKGYVVLNARVLHAGNYGVPQTRERVIFIGFNKDYLSKDIIDKLEQGLIDPYPPKTHYIPKNIEPSLLPFVSLSDVFSDLEEPNQTKDIEQSSYSKAKYYGKKMQGQTEINLESLGPTIRAEHHGNIEFRRLSKEHGGSYIKELNKGKKERRLTIRECARIQTFPDEYEFIRTKEKLGQEFALSQSNAYKIIGNAVPPLLAFNIAWQLQNKWTQIFGESDDNNTK